MLAQLYMRKDDFRAAAPLIDKLSQSADPELRRRADALRSQVAEVEKFMRSHAGSGPSGSGALSAQSGRDVNGQLIVYDVDSEVMLRESLRKPSAGETQIQGRLVRIDCDSKSITFVVRIDDRFRKLTTDSFKPVNLMTFTTAARGELTCGPRNPEDDVVVAYIPASDSRSTADGVIKSVEFVPHDFKLKP